MYKVVKKMQEIKGGMTNKLYKYKNWGIRINEPGIDRDMEYAIWQKLGRLAGIVFDWVPGEPIALDDLRTGMYSEKIAHELAKWHRMVVKANVHTRPFWYRKIQAWLNELNDKYIFTVSLDQFQDLRSLFTPVICHNDLNAGNLIVREDTITFIDFEYAAWNDLEFDIANHFCEWAGLECDWTKMPTKEQKEAFLRAYAKSHDLDIALFLENVDAYIPISHFFWGVWGVWMFEKTKDPSYLEYASKRTQFKSKK